MKKELTQAQKQLKRRMMFWGFGWGYLTMIVIELINVFLFAEESDWRLSSVVARLAVWTLAGFGMGRWLQWRAGLIGKKSK